MTRRKILWKLTKDGSPAYPCGCVVDRGTEGVWVDTRGDDDSWSPNSWLEEAEYKRGSIDRPRVLVYRPGDPEYFDCVVEDLNRTYAVTNG